MSALSLRHGLTFEDLHARDGLSRLDAAFVSGLAGVDAALHNRLVAARAAPDSLAAKDESTLLIDLAPHLDDFLADLFGVTPPNLALRATHARLMPLYDCKRLFVQRHAARAIKQPAAEALDGAAVTAAANAVVGIDLADASLDLEARELAFATTVPRHLDAEYKVATPTPEVEALTRYAAWALFAKDGKARHRAGALFKQPHKLDFEKLVPVETETVDGVVKMKLPRALIRPRDGFHLTDQGGDLAYALDHTQYCIWCHNQGKDSCSRGYKDRKTGAFTKSPFGVTLAGCPLEEKISEMNLVKGQGYTLGALAIVAVDNPLCAATGHRICNDCMKACIYQKQEPVDIPQIETRTLKDALSLPWGFEIYSLLTRWNPMNLRRPLPRPSSGRTVLVVGLGPAGFNLAHHLINDGHHVVAIDGLKIEPIEPGICGVNEAGGRVPFAPLKDFEELREDLGERVLAGFGGVAEYGITVRWDKNFLKTVRLLLERRSEFAMVGGTRFGGALTIESAFAMGFDHIALCMGAGKPTVLDMPNGLARGVRQASDFLMALQLTGAAKKDSLANLQIRLPVVVIGGGLTAIDTATESLAYYTLQVEKFLARYETLVAERGESAVQAGWSAEEREIATEYLIHARALHGEREAAEREGRVPEFARLAENWGGVTIAYRRRMIDSPSYTLNHEEVHKGLEEGIRFAEGLTPVAVEIDEHGHASGLKVKGEKDGVAFETVLPARSILVAAGTQPNTVLAREDGSHAMLDGKYFRALDEDGNPVAPERIAKPATPQVLMYRHGDGRTVSFWGDLHPSFAGNVVKAMGGTKQGYPVVSRMLARVPAAATPRALIDRSNAELRATVHAVHRLTPTIVEVVVKAPAAARAFEPGQFYRLQNFEAHARRVDDTVLAMEGIALTGAWCDKESGLLSTIVLEMGGSSDLCAHLKPGEPVILMGPTGTPTEVEAGETVVLVGGGLGNAVLFSIGAALRAAGSKVLYFAGYKRVIDRYKVAEIEAAADVVVWCCDEAPGFAPGRKQDRAIVANIVEAMRAYASGELGEQAISYRSLDRIIAIGSDGMMNAVRLARHGVLAPFIERADHHAIASINSPMQCMMKEICAQCLQRHVDPASGRETVVFSCFNQDQRMDLVDFANLRQRLTQQGLQEKLSKLWLDRALKAEGVRALAAE
ncbi:MAG: FAD-dependent oxidoreductase [Alphaproteobacteria bacterium]|nr:FAD-dependent oxidoreductase [Alphaproteobacteria bacterium]MCW5741972.1 FAD-dependent oxidoreductase [Alphaproteobacteria bacterium]